MDVVVDQLVCQINAEVTSWLRKCMGIGEEVSDADALALVKRAKGTLVFYQGDPFRYGFGIRNELTGAVDVLAELRIDLVAEKELRHMCLTALLHRHNLLLAAGVLR